MAVKVSTAQVKELREQSGASVMDCREALVWAKGNIEKALEYLRQKGKKIAQKKSGRETKEGAIASYIHGNRKIGALVELRCETDFVAKNPDFQQLASDLAMHVTAMAPRYLSVRDAPEGEKSEEKCLLSQSFIKNPNLTVADLIEEEISRMGENIVVERFVRFEI